MLFHLVAITGLMVYQVSAKRLRSDQSTLMEGWDTTNKRPDWAKNFATLQCHPAFTAASGTPYPVKRCGKRNHFCCIRTIPPTGDGTAQSKSSQENKNSGKPGDAVCRENGGCLAGMGSGGTWRNVEGAKYVPPEDLPVDTTKKTFAFMVDRSGSMDDARQGFQGETRFTHVVDVLIDTLKRKVPQDGKFSVSVFNTNIAKFQNDALVDNTEQNRQALATFFGDNLPTGGTDLLEAIKELFKSEADELFLIADGGGGEEAQIRALVTGPTAKKINVIGIEVATGPEKTLLEDIARAKQGRTQFRA